jgi:hypothetical protein
MDFKLTQRVLVFIALAGAWFGQAEQAIADDIYPPLQQWSFDGAKQTLSLTVHQTALPRYFILKEPNRIVLDVVDTSWPAGTISQTLSGNVSQIRISQLQAGTTRFVLDWAEQKPLPETLQLTSLTQSDGSVIWRLDLETATMTSELSPLPQPEQGGKIISGDFPPALLAPNVQRSVTIDPPPNF